MLLLSQKNYPPIAKHSKTELNESLIFVKTPNSIKSSQFDLVWRQNLLKCIDASPLIVQDKVIIGSHKGIFASFDLMNGKEQWKIQLDDRIGKSII